MNHYNPKVELTAVVFERNGEGRYVSKGTPLILDPDLIILHGDGWIQLNDSDSRILVEEDAQSITSLLDQKIREAEIYQIEVNKNNIIGGDTVDGDD